MSYLARWESWEGLRPHWQRLWEESEAPIFASPAWLEVWWEEFGAGRELLLLALWEGERLRAVVPLMREGQRLSLVGTTNVCDYASLTVAPGVEEEALRTFLAALSEERWEEVELWGLPADGPLLHHLQGLAPAQGYLLRVEREAVCPRIALPTTWEEYLASLPRAERHELRRKLRRLLEGGGKVHFYHLTSPREVAEGLNDFLRLHVESREDKALFMTEAMARFFSRMALSLAGLGLLHLYFLELEGRRVATVLAFACRDTLCLYNSGYDPKLASLAVGFIAKALCVREAIAQGRRFLDFLRGDERYKYQLGARDREVYRCLLRRRAP